MQKLLICIDGKDWKADTKYNTFSLGLGTMFAVISVLVWIALKKPFLLTGESLLYFISFSYLLSWIIMYYFSSRYFFHDGSPEKKCTNIRQLRRTI